MIEVTHPDQFPHGCSVILLPIGYMYNREIQRAKVGDIFHFGAKAGGHRITKIEIIPIGGEVFEVVRMAKYGIPVQRLLEVWRKWAVLEGYGTEALDMENCLMIVYERGTTV